MGPPEIPGPRDTLALREWQVIPAPVGAQEIRGPMETPAAQELLESRAAPEPPDHLVTTAPQGGMESLDLPDPLDLRDQEEAE